MICIELVWDTCFRGKGNTRWLKTQSSVANEESKNSEVIFLIMRCYFWNTYPSFISSFGKEISLSHILYGIDLIHSGINLHWIPIPSCLQINFTIEIYNKKQNISQIHHWRHIIYNQYLKTCGHIIFELVGVNFGPECRYLVCNYLKVTK